MFLTYFIISGFISSIIAYHKYDEALKQMPFIEYMGREAFALAVFLTGFIDVWIILPLTIHNWYLSLKIKWIKRREEIVQTKHDRKAMEECVKL